MWLKEDDVQLLGLVWDHFNKYLASLYSNNKVKIWDVKHWEAMTTVDLNFPSKQVILEFSGIRPRNDSLDARIFSPLPCR